MKYPKTAKNSTKPAKFEYKMNENNVKDLIENRGKEEKFEETSISIETPLGSI